MRYTTAKGLDDDVNVDLGRDVSLICEIMNISLSELFGLPSNNSLPEEEKLLQSYRTNPEFKEFIDKYLNDNEFKQVINSIAKISK